jgi:uncharacterized protein with PIN domain
MVMSKSKKEVSYNAEVMVCPLCNELFNDNDGHIMFHLKRSKHEIKHAFHVCGNCGSKLHINFE